MTKFLMTLAILVLALAVQPAAAQARKSITQLTPAEVASLRKGYAQMIAWNTAPRNTPNFRRSLRFWANMHANFGPACANVSGPSNPGMSGLSAQTPLTGDETSTWCTCQHGTQQFLTWHRMYLYHFEKVLQSASGNPALRLPYWDYQANGALPAAFRSPTYVNANNQTVPNPLYVTNRQPALNAGTGSLTTAVTSATAAMGQTTYASFNSGIENAPHGSVHCATGVAGCPSGYMGSVPAAGNDPIFYSHHANIDRLYDCWLGDLPGRLPPAALRTRTFSFIDGAGAPVSSKVGDLMTRTQVRVTYAGGAGCPRRFINPLLLAPRALELLPNAAVIERGRPIVVPAGVLSESKRLANVDLVIDNPEVTSSPTGLVEVALESKDGKRIPLGVVSAFNRTAVHHDHEGHGDDKAAVQLRFAASAALRQVGNDATVTVTPVTGVVSPDKSFESLILTKPVSLRASNVRFEAR